MNITRLKGLFIQEYYITIRSFEVILDIFVSPLISITIFGFMGLFLTNTASSEAAQSLFLGMILWQIISIIQYSVSVGSLWNVWSGNLINMFIAPISLFEYLATQSFSGIVKALVIFIPSSLLSIAMFQFNIYQVGALNLLLFFINLILFSISFGLIMLGLIFRYGTRIQAFAWGILPILQPLTAAFYPVSILPVPLQYLAKLLPPTYIFEAARESLSHPGVSWDLIGMAFLINTIYVIFSVWFFQMMFAKSKETGQFAKLET